VSVGIALISVAKGSAEGIAGYSAAGAATVVGVLAIFNGGGRIVWAAASDFIGRMPAFAAMLGLQGVCLLVLPHAGNAVLWFVLAAVIYLCYGGGFGTMPATAGDFFGVKNAGAIYGLMLVGWSLGGVIGPIVISTLLGDSADDQNYTLAYTVMGIIALVSVALTFITKVPKDRRGATT
jgi:OFA family oxalate/formate antiporter-like MFS transporter